MQRRRFLEMMRMFSILWVPWVLASVKPHKDVHLEFVHFTVYKF